MHKNKKLPTTPQPKNRAIETQGAKPGAGHSTRPHDAHATETHGAEPHAHLKHTAPAVEARTVSAHRANREILHSVSLTAPAGKITAIVGPNGSGKTTLLRAVSGAGSSSGGKIKLFGDDISHTSLKAQARLRSVVAQHHADGAGFSVRDIVRMGCEAGRGMFEFSRAQDAAAIRDALAATDTKALAGRRFCTLSGGEQQRVLIARALAQRAPLMILDEPTNHLDLESQMKIMELIRGLTRGSAAGDERQRGLTRGSAVGDEGLCEPAANRRELSVLLTLHDLNIALHYGDRVVVLSGGEVVAEGDTSQVLTPQRIEDTFAVAADRVQHPRTGSPHLLFGPLPSEPTTSTHIQKGTQC